MKLFAALFVAITSPLIAEIENDPAITNARLLIELRDNTERAIILNENMRQLFEGIPEAEYYFSGRMDAFTATLISVNEMIQNRLVKPRSSLPPIEHSKALDLKQKRQLVVALRDNPRLDSTHEQRPYQHR